ncbi:hypothetical protein GUITHDRAFT_112823 [Guillardia theta CCMP2712]|uniref:Uncharacterized protein n=1 Tax=Guillardia theta (strain CCMP2712) TaxID=905079 RepID=L1IZ30_GUITC|nr:hypothetical protein GUITHDRAFT_112823 [Guillardia theta CCMP2712]EKX41090.1 hypothetical protein GUITHDRAFT_112823 [Guillardia theta CCMP2712]|eukprot:XP_005828070.1 hypothetical protein GUITHDRAFT_112823 [Guillardia theta CCMP2712]
MRREGVAAVLLAMAGAMLLLMSTRMRGNEMKTSTRSALEDTEIDKLTMEHIKMCCSTVPWPCCQHESCCDAWEDEGLDEVADKSVPTVLYQIPKRLLKPIRMVNNNVYN